MAFEILNLDNSYREWYKVVILKSYWVPLKMATKKSAIKT